MNIFNAKRALISSILALALCCSTLLGTTYAWFTDGTASGENTVVAGNFDLDVQYTLDGDSWNALDGAEDLFQIGLWEPGHTEVVVLKIENKGSLAMKYKADMSILDEVAGLSKNGDVIKLSEILTVSTLTIEAAGVDPVFGFDIAAMTLEKAFESENAIGWGEATVLAEGSSLELDKPLYSGKTQYLFIKLDMPAEVGDEVNHDGINVPSVDLGVSVLATQFNAENDSFGNGYDSDAAYPELDAVDTWDGSANLDWFLADPTATTFVLGSAEDLAGLSAIVSGNIPAMLSDELELPITFDGKTILLDSDVDLYAVDENGERINFDPIGHSANGEAFTGIFDGQGHTISNLYVHNNLDAWQYEGEYYALFAYTEGATIKNVNIADAYVLSGRNEAACIVGNAVDTVFSDINIINSTLIAYNNSAGGIASECYGECSFTNITVDEDTVIGPLWGTYDVRLGGIVGMVKSDAKVSFSGITVACQLDAINDVAANYQYWLYRYCGMLIGQVDGVNGMADPTGYVTCEDVTVIYGDWVNYHYCEDADNGAGSYNGEGEYKYGRVEAGTGTNGIDIDSCNHNEDESHYVLIVFDQLFGGGQGVSGLVAYDGVTVIYPGEN